MAKLKERISHDNGVRYSIKMRLGWHDAKEWRQLMPLLNDIPLEHITIHPRIAKQMYNGELIMTEFEDFLIVSYHPVIFNGEIKTIEDIHRISHTHPTLAGIMIGRGLLARPSLGTEYKNGQEWSQEKRLAMLLEFHSKLFTEYQSRLCGDTQLLQKIKPFWDYLEPEIGHRAYKAIRKATTLRRYKETVNYLMKFQ